MTLWNIHAERLTSAALDVSPAEWCRAFLVISACIILAVGVLQAEARDLILSYGPRNARNGQHDSKTTRPGQNNDGGSGDLFLKVVSYVTSWGQVPHAWFATYYVTCLLCSVFWFLQYVGHGAVLRSIASSEANASEKSMSIGQVALVWVLMCMQAGRRLFEHIVLFKSSNSKMWFIHWLIGILFYMVMSVSVWIEGSAAISTSLLGETVLEAPPLHTVIGISAFLFAWTNQYWCHKHLAGLEKYSLPHDGMFRYFVCAHYTCECLLYLSLAIVAAPEGALLNQTLLCALLFVVVNLGITASATRRWYIEKFGAEKVTQKWNMIPFVF